MLSEADIGTAVSLTTPTLLPERLQGKINYEIPD
jgi:hypothetical protein